MDAWRTDKPVSILGAELAESPVWDQKRGLLWWVDIDRGEVKSYRPDGASGSKMSLGQPVGAVAVSVDGRLIAAAKDGFICLDVDRQVSRMIAPVESQLADTQMNDRKCDSAGRFWAGTKASENSPGRGTLYRLDADRAVTAFVEDVGISNGADWSIDGKTMYYIDRLSARSTASTSIRQREQSRIAVP